MFQQLKLLSSSIKLLIWNKFFFTNSGAEAIEGAIKIAKKYHFLKYKNKNGEIIAMKKSFHGRSMGALSITGQEAYQEPFGPMLPHIKFAEFNDLESVKQLITENTCAIFLEPLHTTNVCACILIGMPADLVFMCY